MKTLRLTFILVLLGVSLCKAQQADTTAREILFKADSLASGNYKDVFISFYQLALNNLTGPTKSFHFASNPFAIMVRGDSSLKDNRKYLRPVNNVLRNINFDIEARLDSNFHFDGFATGIRYAIWNERDKATTKIFEQKNRMKSDSIFAALSVAVADSIDNQAYKQTIKAAYPGLDSSQTDSVFHAFIQAFYDAYQYDTISLNSLDPLLQQTVKRIAKQYFPYCSERIEKDPALSLHKAINADLSYLMSSIETKPLWTIGINDTSYRDGSLFKSVQISTEFLKGFNIDSNKIFNMELDIKATYNFTRDSNLVKEKNLNRQVFSFEPAVNIVLKGSTSRQSFMELKIGGGYYNIMKGKYEAEDKTLITLNGTFRIRVFDEIWIPIDIKYDLKEHNLFGFLNVKTNFKALGNIFSR